MFKDHFIIHFQEPSMGIQQKIKTNFSFCLRKQFECCQYYDVISVHFYFMYSEKHGIEAFRIKSY